MITVTIIRRNGQESPVIRNQEWLKELQQLRAQDIGSRPLLEQMLVGILPRDADGVLVLAGNFRLFIALR